MLRGHAIECRINAEDPAKGFLPSPGRITAYREPAGIGVRVDSAIRPGDEVSDLYDPLVAKLIVHDVDREHARRRMLRALEEYVIEGTTTLVSFHRALLESPCFVRGETCAGIVESEELARRAQELDEERSSGRATASDGRRRHAEPGPGRRARRTAARGRASSSPSRRGPRPRGGTGSARRASPARDRRGREPDAGNGARESRSRTATRVEAGRVICVVEAMKMENPIVAHADGVVSELGVTAGEQVANGQVICVIRPES